MSMYSGNDSIINYVSMSMENIYAVNTKHY